ncbi:MAG TPA: hypothetical protein VGE38_12095 [Nocardioides sp.]|uniref:hypothetical protein n=1 Tax=Nocardioides sp. TaxID=35761 RepID=UPI002EDB4A7B
MNWWIVLIIVGVIVVGGWFMAAWVIDRGRSKDVSTDTQRVAPDPAAEADMNTRRDTGDPRDDDR